VRRVAIVTGAGRGIAEATARALARDGRAVALADLNVAEARRAANTLPGDNHAAFAVDVTDERSVEALFDAVEEQLGPVAVLACVAGGPFLTPGRRPSIIETTTENWIRTEALNGRGPFLCIRAMLRRRVRNPGVPQRAIGAAPSVGQIAYA
jgi:NAD(P)-dependent dehydrogenase (short-subunit alcohol dehydrogenase family)